MAVVVFAESAVVELRTMIRTHSLPADTGPRVANSVRPLERFPFLGPALAGDWHGYRFVLGPWPWMVLVYEVQPDERVVVVTVQDARSSSAATGHR